MNKKGFIFDLDGVIVDTAKYHFMAWKKLANGLGVNFSEAENEQLKGVSRVRSLEKILEWGNTTLTKEAFKNAMHQKNEEYLAYIANMTAAEVLPKVNNVLQFLTERNQPIALGSASKNARTILDQVHLKHFFNAIVDGNDVTKAKPNPEVFLKAAAQLQMQPEHCIVFEDSIAGVEAANAANMISIGIGDSAILNSAQYVFKDFSEFENHFLDTLINQ